MLAYRRALTIPFSNDTDISSSFVISFTSVAKGDFAAFAKGYVLAANRLAAALLKRRRFADYEAYPVVFLYRHAFELSLKHVIYAGAELAAYRYMDEIDERLHNHHDVAELARIAGKILSLLFPRDDMLGLIAAIEAAGKDWGEIDPDSYSYRYPIDKKGRPSTKRNQTVSLRTLRERMASLLEDLDTVHFGLSAETYMAQEMYRILNEFVPAGRGH